MPFLVNYKKKYLIRPLQYVFSSCLLFVRLLVFLHERLILANLISFLSSPCVRFFIFLHECCISNQIINTVVSSILDMCYCACFRDVSWPTLHHKGAFCMNLFDSVFLLLWCKISCSVKANEAKKNHLPFWNAFAARIFGASDLRTFLV